MGCKRLFSNTSCWIRPKSINYVNKVIESRTYDIAHQTPLQKAIFMSSDLPGNNRIYLKREDMQKTFSFNVRGAHNKLAGLPAEVAARGVVSCSAGNHAVGMAHSANQLGIQATIVFPNSAELRKRTQVEEYGSQTIVYGDTFTDALIEAMRYARQNKMTFVHPFDDEQVIAGHGTIGWEIIKQTAGELPDKLFVPVGGGGLISGIAAFVKEIEPSIQIIGVEPFGANPMQLSLKAGKQVSMDSITLFTDGSGIHSVGKEPFRLCQEYLDGIVTVTTDEICAAIKDTFGDTRALMEPLGALSVAGLKRYIADNNVKDKKLVAVLAAANMDFDRLRFVAERCDDRERFMAVTIPEVAGSYQRLYDIIYPRNVTEFSYRMHSTTQPTAQICMSIQTKDIPEFEHVIQQINNNENMHAIDLTSNEMAKSHLRHLVGGRAAHVPNERLFRLEFPERSGALKEFLWALSPSTDKHTSNRWNVSLFHYRNHGADVGRVLVAFQVDPATQGEFQIFLDTLGFRYLEETENPIYSHYLQ